MAFVCCILPQSISKNTDTSENVYISNMMLTDLKGEDLKNPQKIGQPIEPSEAKKVSYLVRELMEHLHANENFLNKDYPTNKKMAAETGSNPPGRRMSWVDAVNTEKSSSARLSQCGSPILFCYLPPEFLPKAHQVKSLKKPSKEPRKTMDTPSARDKDVRKSASSHKGCQTETSNKTLNNGYRPIDNQGGMSWWISAPPRVKKKSTSRIQQIYSNRLPPPVPLVTVKNVGKDLCSSPPERKVKALLSPYNKKPKLGLNSSPLKKKPFLI
ncbi:unnamed protein product [Acanthosepion pharaonis]|uniref:Uncharacterized protein n=1 Tax=Acanthosepion pharaonis TaxID=158019 RepID=A0A812C909_ACAPH|nr:unnamed protein product [Sepia pharaonis]